MANKPKGEIQFEALGEQYILRLGVNDLIAVQDALGMGEDDAAFLERIGRLLGLKSLRTIAWKGVRLTNGEEITEELAGEIVTELGIEGFGQKIAEAIRWAWPDAKAKKGGEAKKGKAGSPGRRS